MKIFAVSDIHGHYTELKKALDNAHFDNEDPEHILVCCGDCFDRGYENKKVLEYLSSLKRKVLIRGNHEDILENIIERQHIDQIDIYNGADITVAEFFGEENIDRHGRINISKCAETTNALKKFIGSMYDFYETENHIFTHAWLPITESYSGPILFPDKDHAENSRWKESRYNEWFTALDAGLTVEGKTVVCGHRASYNAYRIDTSRAPEDNSMFLAPGVAAIDSATVRTKNINVYVTEDTLPKEGSHTMSLSSKFFDLMCKNKKTVEIRLFDEKRRALSIGDTINFSCTESPEEKISRRITGLYRYDDFSSLINDFLPEELGCTILEAEDLKQTLYNIYDRNDVNKYGALAIRVSNII